MTKILCAVNYGADYLEYMLVHGLAKVYGAENVVCYPFKNTFVGGIDHYPERAVGPKVLLGSNKAWGELWTDKSMWHIWEKCAPDHQRANDGPPGFYEPITGLKPWKWDDILDGCRNGEFKFILLTPRWFNSAAVSELRETLREKCPPIILCDGEDYYQVRWDYVNAFQIPVYFKRTFYDDYTDIQNPNEPTQPKFFPCPFASLWNTPAVPWEERDIDLFCVFGNTQVLREKVLEIAKEVGADYPSRVTVAALGHPFSHDEYMYKLKHSKIVVDHQRLGTDTVRTWEVLSTGTCMVGDLHIRMPDPLIPDQHFIQYENDMTPEGDKQKLDTLRDALHKAMGSLDYFSRTVADNGYKHVMAKHTTAARAKYIIQSIKDSGIDVGTLA